MITNVDQRETAIKLKIETIGLDGMKFAPKVDLHNLPFQLPTERIEPFSRYLASLGVTESTMQLLYNNLRFIDLATTTRAFDTLASALKKKVQGKPYHLTHLEGEKKSGSWVSLELAGKYGLNEGIVPPSTVGETIQHINSGRIPRDTTIIIPDDLAIFGEQLNQEVISKILANCGTEWAPNIKVALLAATNNLRNGFTKVGLDAVDLIRVFEMPTIGELGIPRLPKWNNQNYILTFFEHKVPDRFLPLLTRSSSMPDAKGRHAWLVDDLSVNPPYDPNRFISGGWSHLAKSIPRDL